MINNAIQNTNDGKVLLDVYYDNIKQQLICVITDEGTGFKAEEQQSLFRLFKTPTEQVLESSN